MSIRKYSFIAAMIACMVVFSGVALAHAPTSFGENHTVATASHIEEPLKSWAIYSQLDPGGEARYYALDMKAGERVFVSLIVSTDSKSAGFLPTIAVMGEGIAHNDSVPAFFEKLGGTNGTKVESSAFPAQATYEAFSPSTFYQVALVDLNVSETGDYYIVVYNSAVGGNFGLAVGYIETYTITEYVTIPFSLLGVYGWEGQNILMILAPMIGVMVVGIALMADKQRKGKKTLSIHQWLAYVAGLMITGSGAIVIFQMLYVLTLAPAGAEVIITLMFAVLPILLGLTIVKISLREVQPEKKRGRAIKLIVTGVISIFVWGAT